MLRMCQQVCKLNSKDQTVQLRNGQRPQQTVLKTRNTSEYQICENKFSASLGIREMLIKTAVRYPCFPIRMAVIQK